MINKETISNLLGVSVKSVYNYDKENRPIIRLLENYFTNDDLEEFLETGEIRRLENYDAERADPLFIEYVKHNIHTKVDIIKGGGIFERLNHLIPHKILISILDDLKDEENIELYQRETKKFLIDRIKGYAVATLEKPSQKQLINLIDKNFSNIECYVLIKYHDEILGK
ncbi:MAG: hypothetical protein PHR75_03385 [Sulfurovum sp.]|nr:hypothetical protein [Sulfurovum sp.]MDD3602480.1 hypothetical protein [Sulfurovum sp.]